MCTWKPAEIKNVQPCTPSKIVKGSSLFLKAKKYIEYTLLIEDILKILIVN